LQTAQRVGHPKGTLFRLADYAAGDARRRAAAGFGCYSVNHDGSAAIAEDGVFIGAKAYVWRHGGYVRGAISPDNQRKIRNISSRCHSGHGVIMTASFEVRTGGFEIRRIAFANLVDVDGMLAGGEALDIEHDFNALWRCAQSGRADRLPLGVLEDDDNRLPRLRPAVLDNTNGADKQQKSRGNTEFHLLSPCEHTNLGIVASRDDDLFYSNAEDERTGLMSPKRQYRVSVQIHDPRLCNTGRCWAQR
jgi:hypothetical protein